MVIGIFSCVQKLFVRHKVQCSQIDGYITIGDATIDGLVTVPNILSEFTQHNLHGVSHGIFFGFISL